MRAYRSSGRVVYVEDEERVLLPGGPGRPSFDTGEVDVVHYVCDVHFRDYLMLRRRVPRLCRLFGTLKEREAFLEGEKGALI